MSFIQELVKKYELKKEDFWELKRSSKSQWIITHDACMKIADKEGIIFHEPFKTGENGEIIPTFSFEPQNCWIYASATLKDRTIWTFGSANPTNCKMPYQELMAEKRVKDRLTLMLIKAYESGVYSEDESHDFKRENNVEKPASSKQHSLIMQLEMQLNVKRPIEFQGLTMKQASEYIEKMQSSLKAKQEEERYVAPNHR